MKGIDIFCASQAAASISCLSMDDPSSSTTAHLGGSGRAIDRYNPIIRDPRRFGGGGASSSSSSSRALPYVPSCSSQTPMDPKPLSHSHQHTPHRHHHHHHHQNKNGGTMSAMNGSSKPSNQKSHSNSTSTKKKFKTNSSNRSSSTATKTPTPNDEEKKKSSGSIKPASVHEPSDFRSSTSSSSYGNRKSWSCSSIKAAAGDFISPPGSSRYLLSDQAAFFNLISEDFDPLIKLLPPVVEAEPPINHSGPSSNNDDDNNSKALQKDDRSMSRSPDQVVVLRVSLHCRGCERKMRKHISRMEGVSSFNIDFAAKKVTVVGSVTPLEVLASISKVKNAQLWTPAAAAAAAATAVPSFTHSNSSEINRSSQTAFLL